MAVGGAQLGTFDTTAAASASPELAAIGRAPEWLNSPRLTAEALAGVTAPSSNSAYTS